ncbi:MAG: cyclopropane-fatty-acyl-phospholipid synthase family protein [Gemmatimonadaceae bacterium]
MKPESDARAVTTTREILGLLFGPISGRDFAVRLWDGSTESPPVAPRFTIVLTHPGALRRMFIPPTELNLAEAFIRQDYDVERDLEYATTLSDPIEERLKSVGTKAKLMRLVMSLPSTVSGHPEAPASIPAWRKLPHYFFRHSKDRDAAALAFTYDTSNEFYEQWLDENMQYTCAYFRRGNDDLDQAQRDKLEHICRKLRLKKGDRLLDIGCGWGGLLRYAVMKYGVVGYGVTLSKEQAAYANDWFKRSGISDNCVADVRDYRDIEDARRFDKVTAVGMVEHVGVARLTEVYSKVYSMLEPGGLFLNHLITTVLERPQYPGDRGTGKVLRQHNEFIQKYMFPDAEMPTIGEVVLNTERVGLEVRDVENLREHYATTFRQWLARCDAKKDEVIALVGEPAYRAFRIYLAAFPPRFEQRWMSLNQVLLCRPLPNGMSGLPPSRDDIYHDVGNVSSR